MFQEFPLQFTYKGELLDNILKFGNWCDINHADEQDNTKEFIRNENILLKAISKSLKRRIILYPVTKSEEECFGNYEHPPYHILACRSGINSIYIPMYKDEN